MKHKEIQTTAIKQWLTAEEVAKRLGISVQTVREKCITGEFKANKVGKEWRILPQEVNRILGISMDNEEYQKELYIKSLEGEVKHYKFLISTLKSNFNAINSMLQEVKADHE